MLEIELKLNEFLMQYCRMLVAEIADERLAEQAVPGVNHPAWILGHLAYSADRARELLGHPKELPATWTGLFGPGSTPLASRPLYPAKDELLGAAELGFELLRQQAAAATAKQLAASSDNPYTKEALPTLEHRVAYLLTGHLGLHLGQLSAWRRMIGLPPLF